MGPAFLDNSTAQNRTDRPNRCWELDSSLRHSLTIIACSRCGAYFALFACFHVLLLVYGSPECQTRNRVSPPRNKLHASSKWPAKPGVAVLSLEWNRMWMHNRFMMTECCYERRHWTGTCTFRVSTLLFCEYCGSFPGPGRFWWRCMEHHNRSHKLFVQCTCVNLYTVRWQDTFA